MRKSNHFLNCYGFGSVLFQWYQARICSMIRCVYIVYGNTRILGANDGYDKLKSFVVLTVAKWARLGFLIVTTTTTSTPKPVANYYHN